MHNAYGQIDLTASPYGVFMAGPSTIGDIEGVIIHVAQGARSHTIFLMGAASKHHSLKCKRGSGGKRGTDGWSYELMMIAMNFVIATTAGGRFVLERLAHEVVPIPAYIVRPGGRQLRGRH